MQPSHNSTAPPAASAFARIFGPFGPWSPAWAWLVWTGFALGMAIKFAIAPESNTITRIYRDACAAWWGSREMYSLAPDGYLYLPPAAVLYSPFYFLPPWLGEPLYRLVVIGLLALACWKLTLLVRARPWNELFWTVSAITIGVGAGSALNGQFNLPLAATLIFGACALMRERWWAACFWLGLSLILKPIAIAPVLLATALYPALWWRMPLTWLAVGVLPFALSPRDPAYVLHEYSSFWTTMISAAQPTRPFAEFSSVLYWCGLDLSGAQKTVVRGAGALLTLALGYVAIRRHGPVRGGLLLWALGAAYLMIFNPRTEGVTYVVIAPAIALFSALEVSKPGNAAWRRALGIAFIALAILMMFVHELMPRGGEYARWALGRKDMIVRPSITILFYLWLGWLTLFDDPPPPTAGSINTSVNAL